MYFTTFDGASIKSLTFYDKLLSAQYYKASQKFSKEKEIFYQLHENAF